MVSNLIDIHLSLRKNSQRMMIVYVLI